MYKETVLKIEITLGNDAMQTGADVAAALTKIAAQLRADNRGALKPSYGRRIMDANGNSVGEVSVETVEAHS